MPIFEYMCDDCGFLFEELVRSAASTDEVICPGCGSSQVKKQISIFASRIAGSAFSGSFSSGPAPSCSTGST